MKKRLVQQSLQDLISEDDIAIFLASSKQFSRKIVYGKWFLPVEYSSVNNFEKEVKKIFGHEKWTILDSQNFPTECLKKPNLTILYEISSLTHEYGIDSVRGYYFMYKRAPSISNFQNLFQGIFDNELEFVCQHLFKTGALEKLSSKVKQGGAWKKYLLRKRQELIPYQFTSLPINGNEVLIYQREGLSRT